MLIDAFAAATAGAVCLSERHVEPHLVIGDMAAGQWADPSIEKIHPQPRPVAITRRSAAPERSCRPTCSGVCASGRATPSLHAQAPERFLILIVGRFSP